MKKLTIFSLIILSNLVTNVEAMGGYQTPVEIQEQMREAIDDLGTEYKRILRIEDESDRLAELQGLEDRADNVEDFLRRNQQYGVGGLRQVKQIKRKIKQRIAETTKLVMDSDTEIEDSD